MMQHHIDYNKKRVLDRENSLYKKYSTMNKYPVHSNPYVPSRHIPEYKVRRDPKFNLRYENNLDRLGPKHYNDKNFFDIYVDDKLTEKYLLNKVWKSNFRSILTSLKKQLIVFSLYIIFYDVNYIKKVNSI